MANTSIDKWRNQNPYMKAQQAHEDLKSEAASCRRKLTNCTDQRQEILAKLALYAKVCRGRAAVANIEWTEKHNYYWTLLRFERLVTIDRPNIAALENLIDEIEEIRLPGRALD